MTCAYGTGKGHPSPDTPPNRRDARPAIQPPSMSHRRPDGRSDLEVMVEEFAESVRKDTKPPIDLYESLDMTLPGIIAHQSGLKGGVKLEVPNSRAWH